MSGFVAKLLKQTALVYDIRWTDPQHRQCYIIFQVERNLHRQFIDMLESEDQFTLTDYGQVLYKGFDEPDEKLKALLQEKYGMYEE